MKRLLKLFWKWNVESVGGLVLQTLTFIVAANVWFDAGMKFGAWCFVFLAATAAIDAVRTSAKQP